MKIRFKATEQYPNLPSTDRTVDDWEHGDVQDLPPNKAVGLATAFPNNFDLGVESFKEAVGPAENKAVTAPTETKAPEFEGEADKAFVKRAVKREVIERKGVMYHYNNEVLGRSYSDVVKYLGHHPDTLNAIAAQLNAGE